MRKHLGQPSRHSRLSHASGFSLVELMIAMGVFLIVGGAAMSLFRSHANLFGDQQGTVVLNISLRNALSQIQTDAVQAGNGFYGSLSTANQPVGITITNTAGAFDQLYVIQAATQGVQINPGTPCPLLTTSGVASLAATPGIGSAQFPAGSMVLFMNGAGNQMTVAKLTGSAGATGAAVNLTYNPTNADGTNSAANDPFGLTATPTAASDQDQITDSFCPAFGDYVVPLNYVKYSVDAQNRLIRETAANLGNGDVIAEQIISFKVGAATFQNVGTTSTPSYSYTPATYGSKYSLIRSIRVSVIGRTNPNQFTGTAFRNSFDGGFYKIQALSLVVNPRNLSMND